MDHSQRSCACATVLSPQSKKINSTMTGADTMNALERNADSLSVLKQAFADQRLSLFLGAGVSVANGLPTWDKLVLSLYFATIGEQHMGGWRPFSNYLYAISEWYLKHSSEPLEITARKVKSFYEHSRDGDEAFLEAIRDAIYGVDTQMTPRRLLRGNDTLKSIVKLCKAKHKRRFGVRSVITYNYDGLLEMTLKGKRPLQAVYSKNCDFGDRLPIFHYNRVSIEQPDAIIFTEDQYNVAASDPYSWSNIIQLREMSSSVGLMIGLSLTDRNIRRLLDALSRSPIAPSIFALLEKPRKTEVSDDDTEEIHFRAIEIFQRFKRSGIKGAGTKGSGIKGDSADEEQAGFRRQPRSSKGMSKSATHNALPINMEINSGQKGKSRFQKEIRGIINSVESLEQRQQDVILRQLGITPIWYDDHAEIPQILAKIA